MHFTTALAVAATLATVTASPVKKPVKGHHKKVAVPVKQVIHSKSPKSLVQSTKARLNKINHRIASPQSSSGTVTNDVVSYIAPVVIGGTTYNLIVDTGSSNTWCGAQTSCEPSSSGQSTGNSVSVSYGSGSFSGTEYTDSASFGGLTVNSQSVGAASTSKGFTNVDGIIGFGPVDLTTNTVANTNTVPTFMDNLYSQGSISEEVLGVSFMPESGSDNNDANGELTLGGTDSSKYSGDIAYFPTLTSGAAAAYWGISIGGFSYGGSSLGSGASGIVDTGTTLIAIPNDAYNAFLSAAGGQTDSTSGLASFSTAPTENFSVTFGSSPYTLTPDQYLIPQDQYGNFGLSSGKYYAWITQGGSSGVDTIIGQKFLENYYSVFDTTNSQIGFAPNASS